MVNHKSGNLHGGAEKFSWPYGVASELDFDSLAPGVQEDIGKEWLLVMW